MSVERRRCRAGAPAAHAAGDPAATGCSPMAASPRSPCSFVVVCLLFSLVTDSFPDRRQLAQHPAPVGAAADRRGGDDLRHHHRRHRPVGRLGAGAGQCAVGGAAAVRHALAGGRRRHARCVGAAIGAFQGFFIAYEGIPAFIVTLAGLVGHPRRRAAHHRRLLDPDRRRRARSAISAAPGCSACRCRR